MASAGSCSPLIALTGATGFIGARITRHLVHRGWRVRALVRPGSERRLPGDLPLEVCSGTLADQEALDRLLVGADGVVHCAGLVRGLTQAEFDVVNVLGTERLVRLAAARARPPRFILISSLAAREPHLSPYALSKHRAEKTVARFGKAVPWLVLRPPAVYGPGDREVLPLLRAMTRGLVPILGPPEARFSLLFVDDLARAVEKALARPEVSQRIFELDDGKCQGYGWAEVVAIASTFRGGAVLPLPVPAWVLRALAWLAAGGARVFGRSPMLTPAKVNELRHPDWVCDNSPIRQALDWQPEIRFAAGLGLTLAGSVRAVNR